MMNRQFFPTTEHLRLTGPAQQRFHELALKKAAAEFGRSVFVRGVVEVSNYCRQNCVYCGMRRDNRSLDRYRAKSDELAELLVHHRPESITDVNIQAGEDPVAVREVVLPLIELLRRHTPLGVSVCLGTLDSSLYDQLHSAGASVYILKFETGDEKEYERLQSPGNIRQRLNHIRLLAGSGWNVSSGFIAGFPGQSDEQLLVNFEVASSLPLAGCSVSPFVAGEETPFAQRSPGDINLTLNSMAALRLMRPNWVIPAVSALNLAEPGAGYRRGLRTGANLATINLTPPQSRHNYLLYKRDRFIMTEERILAAISAEGLSPSPTSLAEFYRLRKISETETRPAMAG